MIKLLPVMISALVLGTTVPLMTHIDTVNAQTKGTKKTKVKFKKTVKKHKVIVDAKRTTPKAKAAHAVKYVHPKVIGNSALNTAWQMDTSKLNPVMAWEVDRHNQPVVAQTYGDKHNIVYYRIKDNGPYTKFINQAVAAWNNLGVLSLQPAPNDSVSAINIYVHNDPNFKAGMTSAGITYYDYSMDYVGDANPLLNTRIYLEPTLDADDDTTKVNVIEHELGHALGFDHDTERYFNPYSKAQYSYTASIMSTKDAQKANTYQVATIPLGTREANNLRQHYHLNN